MKWLKNIRGGTFKSVWSEYFSGFCLVLQAQTFCPSVGNFPSLFQPLCDTECMRIFAFPTPSLMAASLQQWVVRFCFNKNPGGGHNEMAQFQLTHAPLSFCGSAMIRTTSEAASLRGKWVIKSSSKVSIYADSLTTAIKNAAHLLSRKKKSLDVSRLNFKKPC